MSQVYPPPPDNLPTAQPSPPASALPTPMTQFYVATNPGNNSTAVAALIVAIVSWFICWGIGGALGLVLGIMGRNEARRTGQAGGGLATAAIWISAIQLGLIAIFIGIWLLVAILAAIGASQGSH